MLQMFYFEVSKVNLGVANVARLRMFQAHVSSVSYVSDVCYKCFIWMFLSVPSSIPTTLRFLPRHHAAERSVGIDVLAHRVRLSRPKQSESVVIDERSEL
jgi:hypothetical protein